MNQEQITEIKKCQDSVVYFCNHYAKIYNPIKGMISFYPTASQIEMLNAYQHNRFCVAIAGRQEGKTITSAMYILWKALFSPCQSIAVGSINMNMTREILNMIRGAIEQLPTWLRPKLIENNRYSITLEHGSSIRGISVNGSSTRGYTNTLVYLDEAAFIKQQDFDQCLHALLPTLFCGHHSQFIMSSSPGPNRTFSDLLMHAAVGNEKDIGCGIEFTPVILGWVQTSKLQAQTYDNYIKSLNTE